MPYPPSATDLHQQQRWLRHDAHLWLRHDYARWLKPGADPEQLYPHLKRQREAAEAAKEKARAAEDAAFDAWIENERRWIAAIREEVDELKAARARQRLEEAKYSPDQPRIPKRNPGGGQWTRVGGGVGQSPSANIAQPMGNVDVGDVTGSSDVGGLFQITPDETRVDGVQLAGDPVDLLEQEQRGGHAISEHAGMTYDYLKSRSRDEVRRTLERGDYFDGFSVGSFTSVQSANRLVNSTISDNEDKIDQGIRDGQPKVLISKSFKSPTGYEAYLARAHAEPVIRNTFGVEVVIRPDSGSARGWRVHTAYPVR
jgi:hypothetical protein